MAVSHNHLEATGTKPLASEIDKAEIGINLVDGTLWTKDGADNIIPLATVDSTAKVDSNYGYSPITALTRLTQAQYDAIGTPNATTLYIIVG